MRNLRDVVLPGNTCLPANQGPRLGGPRPTSGGLGGPQHMVRAWRLATILSWSGRPRDCLGGSVCRTAVRYARPFNYGYLKPIDEPNDTSNGFWEGFSNRKRLRLRFRARLRLRLRLRFRCRHRCRRACRRRSRHSSRYVQMNSEFYFEKHNARSERETPNSKPQIPNKSQCLNDSNSGPSCPCVPVRTLPFPLRPWRSWRPWRFMLISGSGFWVLDCPA